jgi:2-oxo-4-hydroxy-4-carboxy-5-ureidoimidazoline decarboxylase
VTDSGTRARALTLAELNAAPEPVARELVRACADIPRWVDTVVAGRPYADLAALLERAGVLAAGWRPGEVRAALAQHPRIGERHVGTGADAELSAREQSAVGVDRDLAERLRDGNLAYEERFSRVFLVRAAGRTGEEILALLERRLGNDEDTEIAETARELRAIALLRIETLVLP